MDDRVCARGRSVEGEPETPQSPWFAPRWCSPAVSGSEMLGERGQKDVPPLVACAGWLCCQQPMAVIDRFPAVLLKELGDKPPPI
jgi:hypothetical protein